ncbi:MAG TPA: phosphotransferase [Chitinispirillaceae bacterium]|nr:phosphotransferase [Chitinispirillaceae bacterium]
MINKIECTPAQIEFLKSIISDFSPETWQMEMAGRAGSSRYFLRLFHMDKSYVLVVWDGRDEDWPRFLKIQNDLSSVVPFLPVIYKDDIIRGLILEEDLGSTTLKNFVQNTANPENIIREYKSVLDAIFIWQNMKIDTSPVIAARSMDLETFLWESWYFAHYCVTDYFACEHLLNSAWEKERNVLANEAAALPKVCIHRDFQSENVMLRFGRIRFVDYQGARLGPAGYDIASLLFDPYIESLDQSMVTELFKYYCSLHSGHFDERAFYICAAQRLMQALGAYGNLSLHKGKQWYRDYIPVAIDRLLLVLNNLPEFPAISQVVSMCKDSLNR